MEFGTRRGDTPEIESDGRYLRNFKKGEVKVRFLEETQDWMTFREHYLEGKSFPCTQDKDTCPGCSHPDEDVQRASRKYATNLYLVDVERTLPFRIPVSLAKSMDTRSDKNGGTILNRDYVVMRTGKGLDTEYDVDSDERYALDTKSLLKDGLDINELLEESYNEVWGEKPVEEKPKTSSRLGRTKAKVDEPVEEELPFEAKSSPDDEDLVIDEDALYDMALADLIDLGTKVGIENAEDMSKPSLIRSLLSEVGV